MLIKENATEKVRVRIPYSSAKDKNPDPWNSWDMETRASEEQPESLI